MLLECCTFSRYEDQLIINFPKVLSLQGITPYMDRSFWDHEHYKNTFGDLQVRCDSSAIFVPSSRFPRIGISPGQASISGYIINKKMMGLYMKWFPEFEKTFPNETFDWKNPYDSLTQHTLTNWYFQQFFKWLNEVTRKHGIEHLIEPTELVLGIKL